MIKAKTLELTTVGVMVYICREELALNGAQEGGLSPSGAQVGGDVGLFSSTSPDVQSLWSFNETFDENETA